MVPVRVPVTVAVLVVGLCLSSLNHALVVPDGVTLRAAMPPRIASPGPFPLVVDVGVSRVSHPALGSTSAEARSVVQTRSTEATSLETFVAGIRPRELGFAFLRFMSVAMAVPHVNRDRSGCLASAAQRLDHDLLHLLVCQNGLSDLKGNVNRANASPQILATHDV